MGHRGQNRPADVVPVRRRFLELGFDWISGSTGVGPMFVQVIRLFQSIKEGRHTIGGPGVDGRVDPNGDTLRWLNAINAPRWVRMTEGGPGFLNHEVRFQIHDNHDFGTSWLDDMIRAAGAIYQSEWLERHPRAAPLSINDASLPRGGDTPDHAGHETGLACDVRLPRKDGDAGRVEVTSPEYDRDSMRAQLQAIWRSGADVDRVFLEDDALIDEGLCAPLAGHTHHAHVQICPPARSAPSVG